MDNPENHIALQEYITTNKTKCKTEETHVITIKNKRKIFLVYRIPLNYLYFNIKNGRFRAECMEIVRKRAGKELDSTDSMDAKIIQDKLLELDPVETKRTTNDIKKHGQADPGIITHDGFVIDGNRRLAILNKLHNEDSKFSTMKVACLPDTIDKHDLWKIETGIQLGKDAIVRYSPINELLKLREGIEAGFSYSEIVNNLYGIENNKEISNKIDLLKLMDEYLDFLKSSSLYSLVNKKMAHFEEAQLIIKYCSDNYPTDFKLQVSVKHAIWILITKNYGHREIRKILSVLRKRSDKALTTIRKISDDFKHTCYTNTDGIERSSDLAELNDEIESDDLEDTPDEINVRWISAMEELKVTQNEKNIPRLLTTVLQNLQGVDYSNSQIKSQSCIDLIKKILFYTPKLEQVIQDE